MLIYYSIQIVVLTLCLKVFKIFTFFNWVRQVVPYRGSNMRNSFLSHVSFAKRVFNQQTFVLMKTSWRRLSSSSSEDVFKTSSRCLDQDEYVRLSLTSSEDVLVKTNIFVLAIRLQDVFKTFSRRLQNVFKTSSRHLQDVFKTSSRHLQDLLKTFWRRLQDIFKTSCKDLFKTFSRRFINWN